jgi:hypothetical protein
VSQAPYVHPDPGARQLRREYIPVVAAAVSDGTRRAYTPYWNRVLDQWADISLSDRTPTGIQRLVQHIKANLTVRRNTRSGNSAAEHLIAPLRCLYRHAVNDELVDERSNPSRDGSPATDERCPASSWINSTTSSHPVATILNWTR